MGNCLYCKMGQQQPNFQERKSAVTLTPSRRPLGVDNASESPAFVADSAAAEVFLHGCCSSLNKTRFHHLPSVKPPPLVLSQSFKAEILSQTVQEGHIQSRSVEREEDNGRKDKHALSRGERNPIGCESPQNCTTKRSHD